MTNKIKNEMKNMESRNPIGRVRGVAYVCRKSLKNAKTLGS